MGLSGAEVFFMLFFFSYLALFFLKVVNVMSLARLYGRLMSWVFLIGGVVVFGLSLLMVMVEASLLLSVLFKLESWSFIIFILLHIFEFFLFLSRVRQERSSRLGFSRDEEGSFSVWRG